MGASQLLGSLAGHYLVRRNVNTAFRQFARRRVAQLQRANPKTHQRRTLARLVQFAKQTQFGLDHAFASIRDLGSYQKAVPLRTYECLWDEYLKPRYPVFENLTWPGLIPYLAQTSGTTLGATKYIPVSREMLASNEKAARTLLAFHLASRSRSRLFHGRLFFLGGSSDLESPAPGVGQGDLSGIAAKELNPLLRAYSFPPLDLALVPDWDRKLGVLAESSRFEPITAISGVPSWLLLLFRRLLEITGKRTVVEVWPDLELVIHGGVKFDPYRACFREILGDASIALQESYPCSEGFVAFGDPDTGLLRLGFDHGLFYEFVPVEELASAAPTRHWIGDARVGVNYAIVVTTCAGLWSHVIGDTIRFESLSPPLLTFTGRTRYALSAFGEHLINEEVEAAIASACEVSGARVRDWHVGPVFLGALGHHVYVVEFTERPFDLNEFRDSLDRDLADRNADYLAHRADRVGIPLPEIVSAKPGALDDWMRSRGKLGGQHKFPRMDGTGTVTAQLIDFLRSLDAIDARLGPG